MDRNGLVLKGASGHDVDDLKVMEQRLLNCCTSAGTHRQIRDNRRSRLPYPAEATAKSSM